MQKTTTEEISKNKLSNIRGKLNISKLNTN